MAWRSARRARGLPVYGFLVGRLPGNRCSPGRDIVNGSSQPKDIASAGWAGGVIVVNTVVISAQHGQVGRVGFSARLPRDDVVDLAVVRRFIAVFDRAGGVLRAGHDALLEAGKARKTVQPHRADSGVDQCGVASFGELVGEKLRAAHAPTVGELEFDVIAVMTDDFVELIECYHDVRSHRRPRPHTFFKEDLTGGVQEVGGVNGLQGATHGGDVQRGVGNRE